MHQHEFALQPEASGLTVLPGKNLMRIHLRPKREEPLNYSAPLSGPLCFQDTPHMVYHVSAATSHTAPCTQHLLQY